MCAANGVSKVIVGVDGIFSTPAVSAIIRKEKVKKKQTIIVTLCKRNNITLIYFAKWQSVNLISL